MKKLLLITFVLVGIVLTGCSAHPNRSDSSSVENLCLADTIKLLDVEIGSSANVIMSQFERMGYKTKPSVLGFYIKEPFMWGQLPFSHATVFADNDTVVAVSATYTLHSLKQGEDAFAQFKDRLYPDTIKSITPPETIYLEEIRYFNGKDSVNLFLDKTEDVEFIDEGWNVHGKDVWKVSIITKRPQK